MRITYLQLQTTKRRSQWSNWRKTCYRSTVKIWAQSNNI